MEAGQFGGAEQRSVGSQGSAAAAEWCSLLPRVGGHSFPGAAAAELMGDLIRRTPRDAAPCRWKVSQLNSPTHEPTRNEFSIL